jgi:hypothetical protein
MSSILPISVYQQNKQTPLTFVHKKDHDDNFFSFLIASSEFHTYGKRH